MSKNELSLDIITDYELIGIISSVKNYQLAFHLNKMFDIDLTRTEDLRLSSKSKAMLKYPVFYYDSDEAVITLLGNHPFQKSRGKNSYLLNERKEFDYLFKIEGIIQDFEIEEVLNRIRTNKTVQFANILALENIDSKENLIY